MRIFENREDAGNELVKMLKNEIINPNNLYIVAIPNGGVPVALPIAQHFKKPLYVMITRKIQFPWTTESGFGAITSDGITEFNQNTIYQANLSKSEINSQSKKALEEVKKREKLFMDYIFPQDITDWNLADIILIDDGIASGITTLATTKSLIKRGAKRIIVAVPTAHENTIREFKKSLTSEKNCSVQVISPDIRDDLSFAVANAYKVWYDEENENILQILKEYNKIFREPA